MKTHFRFVAALAAVVAPAVMHAATARADVITLTFEGLKDQEQIQNYYNGGLGSLGSGPGPNYGVTFGAGAEALIDSDAGGSGNPRNDPSGVTTFFFPSSTAADLDYAAGFTTGFSTFYALQTGHSAALSVYSGLDGTGTLLGTTTLASTPTPYTVFVGSGVSFAGTAHSIVFSGDANYSAFDNITFGSATPTSGVPGTPLPKSATAGLGLLGLTAAGAGLRRRRVAAV